VKEVKTFVADAAAFRSDWETTGPMVEGLDPKDAAERLKKFQGLFEVRKRKWQNFASGEELFGMIVTTYPELEETEREIALLDRLYALYLAVLAAFEGYAEVNWSDLGIALDGMADQVNAFSAQAKKMPKSLREWPAYLDCKKRIEDFLVLVPLLQSLLSKAMRPRHWEALQTITGKQLDLREDVFLLGHMFECNLQEHIDDVRSAPLRVACASCFGFDVAASDFLSRPRPRRWRTWPSARSRRSRSRTSWRPSRRTGRSRRSRSRRTRTAAWSSCSPAPPPTWWRSWRTAR